VLGVGAIVYATQSGGGTAADDVIQLPPEVLNNAQELVNKAQGIKKGSDDAPIKLLVFSDYMCPACQTFATRVEPSLGVEFIDKGVVQMVFYDFPLGGGHRWSFLAARAARCAGDEGKFWEYHDILFAQRDWMYSGNAPVPQLEALGKQVGLGDEFNQCLRSDKYQDVVTYNKALGDALGVRGTPTLFMNGRQLRNEWSDFDALKLRIQEELGTAK
jgi:protein-disulfide isomerase